MVSIVKQLSKIDDRTKNTVNGWIRECEQSLQLRNIPRIISAICILYFRMDEIFALFSDKEMRLSENKKCITKINNSYWQYCCYGVNEILSTNQGVYEWYLKINKPSGSASVGISAKDSFNNNFVNDRADYGEEQTYCYEDWKYGNPFQSGDEISIYLDLDNNQLKFSINNLDQGIAFNVKQSSDIKYRLMVSLNRAGDSIQIQDFQRTIRTCL